MARSDSMSSIISALQGHYTVYKGVNHNVKQMTNVLILLNAEGVLIYTLRNTVSLSLYPPFCLPTHPLICYFLLLHRFHFAVSYKTFGLDCLKSPKGGVFD